MFSCLVLESLAPLDMMDEPRVWRDKSWTDGSDTHSNHNIASLQTKARGTSSGGDINYTTTVSHSPPS